MTLLSRISHPIYLNTLIHPAIPTDPTFASTTDSNAVSYDTNATPLPTPSISQRYPDHPISLLMQACIIGNKIAVHGLILNGAFINHKDMYNNTPLHYAIHHTHPDIIELLILYNANINTISSVYGTPLMQLVKQRNTKPVLLALSKGADPELGGVWKCIHEAVWNGDIGILMTLMSSG